MTVLLSGIAGYLIGSLPTANGIARLRHIDLRHAGSGNPGTNNARKLGGLGLAVPILIVELVKGVISVLVGEAVGGDPGAVMAGAAAIAGNVFNVWYRLAGGKGLAITGGVLLALWPPAFVILVITIIIATVLTKSTGRASLTAIAMMIVLGVLWGWRAWPNAWGVSEVGLLPYFASVTGAILTPKHLTDTRGKAPSPA